MSQQPQTDPRVEENPRAVKMFLIKRYAICIAIAVVILFVVLFSMGLFDEYTPTEDSYDKSKTAWVLRKLTDGFAIDGVLFVCCAGLVFCNGKGAYDGLAFGVRQAIGIMFKKPEKMKYKDLYEYKQARADRRPEFKYMLWIGLALLAIAAVLYVTYYIVNK